MKRKNKNGIYKIDSGIKGPKIAIFSGVHGNETAGIEAVKKALKEIEIKKGVVYFVFANQKAIEKNIRYIDVNLNRCFLKENKNKKEVNKYELKRAVELMKILDEVDILLDLHSTGTKDSIPFAITEDNGFDIVKKMNFDIVVRNFDMYEPGATDGYMSNNGKIGICLECGYIGDNMMNLAYESILKLLKYFQVIDLNIDLKNKEQKYLKITGVQKVTDKNFRVVKNFDNFEEVDKGTLIAIDDNKEYRAKKKNILLFATMQKRNIGDEAYITAEWVSK